MLQIMWRGCGLFHEKDAFIMSWSWKFPVISHPAARTWHMHCSLWGEGGRTFGIIHKEEKNADAYRNCCLLQCLERIESGLWKASLQVLSTSGLHEAPTFAMNAKNWSKTCDAAKASIFWPSFCAAHFVSYFLPSTFRLKKLLFL